MHSLSALLLALLIGYKSSAPIKELFGPAPWLHYYDEYFLVNSQGVFGFINQERTVLALSYTHDQIQAQPTDCKVRLMLNLDAELVRITTLGFKTVTAKP